MNMQEISQWGKSAIKSESEWCFVRRSKKKQFYIWKNQTLAEKSLKKLMTVWIQWSVFHIQIW